MGYRREEGFVGSEEGQEEWQFQEGEGRRIEGDQEERGSGAWNLRRGCNQEDRGGGEGQEDKV